MVNLAHSEQKEKQDPYIFGSFVHDVRTSVKKISQESLLNMLIVVL